MQDNILFVNLHDNSIYSSPFSSWSTITSKQKSRDYMVAITKKSKHVQWMSAALYQYSKRGFCDKCNCFDEYTHTFDDNGIARIDDCMTFKFKLVPNLNLKIVCIDCINMLRESYHMFLVASNPESQEFEVIQRSIDKF